ncbi:hypothetical protein [Paludisphaera mucosa]|uniref:Uncharacterized protein n=1 Tax=Paludisphaera mucosa TaxID=3030827 RepID=A0ABT6FGX4_9BACT|nr:hypothetical protein [Paludisphaera mucosa]MDG3006822.1 hypothetical protein [Paludisphaera mucosa]
MDRRTALMLTTLLGALAPSRLLGQEPKRREPKPKPREDPDFRPAGTAEAEAQASRRTALDADEPQPAGFVNEPGFQWRSFPITRYTQAALEQKVPQKAILDWIFRRTGTADWHGEKTAVLTASKTELRAYNSPEVLDQVDSVVERFTDALEDVLSLHIQVVAAVDTRWRHAVYWRLEPVGSGPQGQQIWTLAMDDAAHVLAQMQMQQGFRRLVDQKVEVVNGQTLTVRTFEPRTYSGGIQRESAAGTGFQPKADKLEESIVLRMSPLLTHEGDAADAAVDLTVNSVQAFQRTKIIAPREVGSSEMSIDVPVAYQTRLDQTIKNWPLGQTLLLSGGIHPGVIDKKGGWLGTPLGAPSSTEVLVFLDIAVASRAKSSARGDAAKTTLEGADADAEADAPRPKSAKAPKAGSRAVRGPDLDPEDP